MLRYSWNRGTNRAAAFVLSGMAMAAETSGRFLNLDFHALCTLSNPRPYRSAPARPGKRAFDKSDA